ncbi:hypothetical protein ARAM_003172 [Aspergillus rambellii]|uniref:C3H1-type domain-containing protein n=1 Tax=Aspergillus rambellii TaxID=308745 RepID=A0A0F8U957_9EURO|nr:hypothetical protein ARAM_003172 [Aspergillus rambellii]
MLTDVEIQALDGNLKTMAQENDRHHQSLENLLGQFNALLESYTRLKSDYEEEKEGRERYKKLARAQERNPFVLVLVDGDGYMFKEHLIKAGVQGGVKAAQLLGDSIKELVHERLGSQADQCRIMVRVYANVLGLSKSLARTGLVGFEARSLSTFSSSFTRAQDLFDYTDAGDQKEGADCKIRGIVLMPYAIWEDTLLTTTEMFRLFADNNQCKHIFFAGCHDTGYLSLLTPYLGRTDRITLIKAASFHPGFESLGFAVRELPAVFMSMSIQTNGVLASHGNHASSPSFPSSGNICKHYQKGTCKFGTECTKIHIMPNRQLLKPQDDLSSQPISPNTLTHLSSVREHDFYARSLPFMNPKSEELIPVNKDGERVDCYIPPPAPEAWDTYTRRSRQHKLCNNWHLGGACGDDDCDFDHTPVTPTSLNVMKYILHQHPCPQGGSCRSLKCYLGHHCQKGGCRGIKPCKFSRHFHSLDLAVAKWEVPIEQHALGASPVSEGSMDFDESAGDRLLKELGLSL